MTDFLVLLGKELRVEARAREMLAGGLILAFLVLLIGNLAWGDLAPPARVAPGALWVGYVFAGVLAFSRNLHRERDRGTWEALALLPVDLGLVYLAKATANALVLLLIQALSLPLFALLFDYDFVPHLAKLVPLLVLGAVGFSAAGTLTAGIAAHGRSREILLPILLIPLLIPVLMMAVQATEKLLRGFPSSDLVPEHTLLIAFDAIYLAIGWLTFDDVLRE